MRQASRQKVSILFLRAQGLPERSGIVAANNVAADDGHGHRAQAAREERIVGAIVFIDVHDGERHAGA